jgi:hypothetical protein
MQPVYGFLILFFFLLTAIGAFLHFRHKRAELVHAERMTAMEKGVALPVFEPATRSIDPMRRNLLFGMIWLFSGAGLAIFLFALSATTPHPNTVTASERAASLETLRKLGASDDELRRAYYMRERESQGIPIGIGTLGFVPMGVGLAYLIFYAAERKRYNGAA